MTFTDQTFVISPKLITRGHGAWEGTLGDLIKWENHRWEGPVETMIEQGRLTREEWEADDFDLADHIDKMTLEDISNLADDPNVEVMEENPVSDDTRAYLADNGTVKQQLVFQEAAARIKDVYQAQYPDGDEDLDGMIGDQLAGAAMIALGDDTLANLGAASREAREQLRGAVVAAFEAGVPKVTIAREAGVSRPTVDAWIGA